MNVNVMKASICTCWTSLVDRVIRVGAPNCATSRAAKVSTFPKTAPRAGPVLSAIAVRAPKYTAMTKHVICTSVTPSITAPILMMYAYIAGHDAVVDDVCTQTGEVEVGHRGNELEQDDERERAGVGAQALPEQTQQHVSPPPPRGGCGSHRAARR